MKPEWKDAPEWANYLAMDGDGLWWWYENEPTLERSQRWNVDTGMARRAEVKLVGHEDSLEQRPTKE
jgi:hypothetical protein